MITHKNFLYSILLTLVFLGMSTISMASVDWEIQKEFSIKTKPKDIATSTNGKWLYILSDNGKILIYSITGLFKDEIAIGNDIESIEAGPRENILFLYNNEKAAVQILAFDFVQKINTSGSPFIGNPEAPVVIVVFTDYQ